MIVFFDNETRRVTGVNRSANEEAFIKSLTSQEVDFIRCDTSDFFVDDKEQLCHDFIVEDGKLQFSPQSPISPDARSALDALADLSMKRGSRGPKPVHIMKLIAAATGQMKPLSAEADARGLTLDELADLIVEKAGADLALEAENQVEILKHEKTLEGMKNGA